MRTVFQLVNNNQQIFFFQFEEWGLYIYNNQEMKIILNEKLALNDFAVQIKYLENIQICFEMIYLIIQTGFHLFNLIKITLSQSCNFISFVLYDSSTNKTTIQRKEQKYEYQFEGRLSNIKLLHGILMVQNHVQLQIIYNFQFQQIIKLNSTDVFFNDLYGLIYFHDQILIEIIFYKFSYPRNLIQPTSKYIFMFSVINTCIKLKINVIRFNILRKNSLNLFQFQTLIINVKILSHYYITRRVCHYHIDIRQKLKKIINLELKYQVNNLFFLLCPNQKTSINKIFFYFIIKLIIKDFQSQKKFRSLLQSCYNLPKFQINTRECYSFSFQSQILLWCQNKNGIRLINFKDVTIKKLK
ncbi:unnamed protein product [Paramecium sonneborni]|uniref:Uncharacterized protein n=1 Tax=Paramecium sonneborni TaxID=65129 RepID=A0A8S1NLF0_9CILI|nr:unnamed protein product [Paramecium sonneborni]